MLVRAVHQLFNDLQRFKGPCRALPRNGIYIFFEKGETVILDGHVYDRVVRVGTHKADGRFPGRIRDHYKGNRGSSVFRRHLGNALLRRADPSDPRLAVWAVQKGEKLPDIEALVTETLKENFSYTCFPVGTETERLELERGMIALLAQELDYRQSDSWLGYHALDYVTSTPIFPVGLWNVNEVNASPLTASQFENIVAYARG